MKRFFLSIAAALAVSAPVASTQELKTAFFLDNYIYSYKLNPGAPIKGRPYTFYSAALGNISFSAQTDFVLPYFNFDWMNTGWNWNSLNFFTNYTQGNIIMPQASVNLFSFGRHGERGRFAFECNVRSDNMVYAPVDFFSDFNVSLWGDWRIPSGTLGFRDISFRANDYVEFLCSYSHKLGDYVTLGANVKFLLGLFGAGFELYDLDAMILDEGDVQVDAYADLFLSSALVKVGTVPSRGREVYDFTQISFGRPGFTGRGLGLDIGITATPIEGLTLGAALLDLGYIRWNESINGSIRYTERVVDYGANLFELEVADRSTLARPLNYNIHLSADYVMPFYSGLSAGVLTTFQEYFREVRLGLALTPLKFISVAGSIAANNFGADAGFAFNIRVPGINLFAGVDTIFMERSMTNASAGIQIAF